MAARVPPPRHIPQFPEAVRIGSFPQGTRKYSSWSRSVRSRGIGAVVHPVQGGARLGCPQRIGQQPGRRLEGRRTQYLIVPKCVIEGSLWGASATYGPLAASRAFTGTATQPCAPNVGSSMASQAALRGCPSPSWTCLRLNHHEMTSASTARRRSSSRSTRLADQ